MALTHLNRPAQESDIIEALQAQIAVESGRVTTANTNIGLKANKAQEDWITPTLTNGWIAEAGRTIKYFKDELGNVKISGRIKAGIVGAIIFTLPTGYRPSEPYGVPIICSNGTLGFLEVTTAGNVILVNGTITYCEIQTVNFRV